MRQWQRLPRLGWSAAPIGGGTESTAAYRRAGPIQAGDHTCRTRTRLHSSRHRPQVVSRTNMVDFAMDIYKKVNAGKPVPAEMTSKHDEVMATQKALKEDAAPLLDLLADTALVANLRAERCFNLAYLQEHHAVSAEHVAALGKHAKFTYDCGDYRSAAELLGTFRLLTPNADEAFSAQVQNNAESFHCCMIALD